MSRLVSARSSQNEGTLASQAPGSGLEYLERVAKFVPAEVVAGYVTISTLATEAPPHLTFGIWLGCCVLCLALTPLYFSRLAKPGDAVRAHKILSPIAFLVWAYAVGGGAWLFGSAGFNVYNAVLASILLVVFSLVSGLFTSQR